MTDAERRTERYSNRFAAHILRQHQFNALCGARHWKNKLRLMVDDEYPPASMNSLLGVYAQNFGLKASVTAMGRIRMRLERICGWPGDRAPEASSSMRQSPVIRPWFAKSSSTIPTWKRAIAKARPLCSQPETIVLMIRMALGCSVFRLLAEAGAQVNARDNEGNTPLHETFLTDVEEELLKLGADVNARNKDGETPIFTTVHPAWSEPRDTAAKEKGPLRQEALRKAMLHLPANQ